MEENVAKSISEPRFRSTLLAAFAGIALVLAAIGIFGVMAYSVAERTRELGVRMALGASRSKVLRLVLGQATRFTLLGVSIGVGASLLLTHYVSTMLFDVRPYDPLTLIEVAAGLTLVALLVMFRRCAQLEFRPVQH